MDSPAIVIDSGSSSMKVGLAGETAPYSVFPSMVGRPRYTPVMLGPLTDPVELFVGDEAQAMRGILSLDYPMNNGTVTNWDDMERLWSHALEKELAVNMEEPWSALLIVGHLSPSPMRRKMLTTFFEKFHANRVIFSVQAVLSLYASGRTTGMVVDSGHGLTHVVPVLDGSVLLPQVKQLDLAGDFVTKTLAQLLARNGYNFVTSAEMDIVRLIKEKFAYVATNYQTEMDAVNSGLREPSTYELPDGSYIDISPEIPFLCTEALFEPRDMLAGFETEGLAPMIVNGIQQVPRSLRAEMYRNVILAGGNTMLPNLEKRLQREMRELVKNRVIKVLAPPERKYSAWLGGSIVAGLQSISNMWITQAEYEEIGADVADQKFL